MRCYPPVARLLQAQLSQAGVFAVFFAVVITLYARCMKALDKPEVSVVMSVFNGIRGLSATLDSVLTQRDVALEFIVVDDGSNDGSAGLLDDYAAADPRMRIIHQDNRGLTQALIRACAVARGEFIARQDAGGDLCLPGRLAKQARLFRGDERIVLVSCATRFVGPQGEFLFINRQAAQWGGPSSHPSVMFRRSAYRRVGGYRPEFYFAQDRDLWLRLQEVGRFSMLDEVLCEVRLQPDDISGRYRREQSALLALLLKSQALRATTGDETAVLQRVAAIRPRANGPAWLARARRAQGCYFIGSCLQARGDARARDYFEQAIKACPVHLKAWLKWLAAK